MSEHATFTIIARDPSVRVNGRILRARVEVPAEALSPGPSGARAQTIDYDSTTRTLYQPDLEPQRDPFADAADRTLLADPHFHARNAFAIAMRTLGRFERALGRHVEWGFGGHQIKIAPHAFEGANAFYSKQNEALLFGYFPARRGRGTVFSCLAHDVVAHEAAHALLDGIRGRYVEPAGPDQAGLHEGFADLVALLSVLALPDVIDAALARTRRGGRWRLTDASLLRVARELGRESEGISALRRPVDLRPSRHILKRREFEDPHRRGEVLVSAVLRAYLELWDAQSSGSVRRSQAIEQGAAWADHALTALIRALDYCPPVDVAFGDFLSAVLTADLEHGGAHSRSFRDALRRSFSRFGIAPASAVRIPERGVWPLAAGELRAAVPAGSLDRNKEELFRFLWRHRETLRLPGEAHLRVESVNPVRKMDARGFAVREVVAEYVKTLRVRAGELAWLTPAIVKPAGMPDAQIVTLTGGGTLIFDEQSRLKFDIRSSLRDAARQSARLQYLWDAGHYDTEPEDEA
jgi:hypothetical protein